MAARGKKSTENSSNENYNWFWVTPQNRLYVRAFKMFMCDIKVGFLEEERKNQQQYQRKIVCSIDEQQQRKSQAV